MRQFYFLCCILLWLPIGLSAQLYSQEEQNEIEASFQASMMEVPGLSQSGLGIIEFGSDGVEENFIPTAGATQTFNPATGDFFFDPGGPGGGPDGTSGNYPNCGCITNSTLAGVSQIEFNAFEVFGYWDWLKIYDGTDTSGTLLFDSNVGGYDLTEMIASNGSGVFNASSGNFHFEFNASTVVNRLGWEVEILATSGGGGGDDLLIVDLTVENQVTITATTAASSATTSGSTFTGFILENFFSNAGTQAIGTTTYVGTPTLTAASVPTDNSPSLFRGSNTDSGMNIWSYSTTATTTFTTGSQAFTGEATWSITPELYAAMLTAPSSGNIYFPADTSDDIPSATLLGTYTVLLPGGGGGNCEWTVTVFGSGLGDEVSWEFRDSDGSVLLSGGPYMDSPPFMDVQTVSAADPVELYIESMGSWNDNTPSFTIANENGIIVNSSIPGGGEATFSDLLCSDLPAPAPANDNCEDITPTTLTNGTPATFTGTTEGATGSTEEINVLGYAAVWEAVTLTGDCNNLTVDYCGTTPGVMDGQMFIVYTDSCPTTDFVIGTYDFTTCGDGNGTIRFYNLPAGTYYLPVIVDTAFNTLGEYTMNVLSEDCPPPPSNDDCDDAMELACGESHSGSTLSANDSGGNPAGDVFYSFTGEGTEQIVTVSLCGSFYDTTLRVFSDCTMTNEIAYNDDSCGLQSEVSFLSDGTSTYIIMVEGYSTSTGEYVINLSCSEPPVYDPCAPVHTGEPNSGIGFSGGYTTANDFNVMANTEFTVEKITFDVATIGGDPTTFSLSFYEGDTGVGTQFGETFTNITPTSVTPNGYLFGFYPIFTVELTLPTAQIFPATSADDKKYWVAIVSELDSSGGFTYWVSTEYMAGSTLPTWQNDGTTWFMYDDGAGGNVEGVMSIEGECETLGLSDMSNVDFAYYPNPVKNTLNIDSQKAVQSVSAFNMTGQKVISNLKVENKEIDLSSLAPGTYVFRATLEGGQIETFKIIKK
ncbi:T9SS type A sorting domain-containing protein [Moheibacter sp.]|uniref:T9SS type A sorting domain-containing protein n=1 Tax=Moheibacter sp. TaxID=1965316 RepID=UPI003C710EBB